MDFEDFEEEYLEDNPRSPVSDGDGERGRRRTRERSTTPVSKRKARGELTKEEKRHTAKTFRDSWISEEAFRGWLKRVPGDPSAALCTACDSKMKAGKSELLKHAEGKKHKSNVQALKANKSVAAMLSQASIAHNEAQRHSTAVKTAEIRQAAFFANNNIAFRTATELIGVQKKSFPDSKICQDITLGPDKCNAIVRNVVAKVETEETAKDLKNNFFTIMVDESTDTGGDKSLILVVRYIYPRAPRRNLPRTTIFELIRLDAKDCSAAALWSAYERCLDKHKIPATNCLGMSSDSASVMVGSANSFWSRLKEKCPWAVLIPCTCHSAGKVSSIACSKLPSFVEKHLRMLCSYLSGSPKRSAELADFQTCYNEELKKMVKPCTTRWLVLHQCVVQYLKFREQRSLQGFFELRCFEDPNKKDEDAHKILSDLNNPFMKAYMEFLAYALNITNEFNGLFQSKSVLIHKLYESSHSLMKTLCMNFMRNEYLDKLGEINVTNPNYFLPEDELELGPGCAEALKTIVPHPDNPETRKQLSRDISAFKQKCLHFWTTAAKEIQSRLPLKNELIRQAAFLDPTLMLTPRSDSGALKDINSLISNFKVKLDLDANAVALEWRKAPLVIPSSQHSKLKSMSVEDFWLEVRNMQTGDGRPMFENLVKLSEAAMILPHANAERDFSIVSDVRTKKRNRMGAECLNAICVVRSAFKSKGWDSVSFEVGPRHLQKHNSKMYERSQDD